MDTINDRIAAVVEQSGLTKTAFADAIELSQPYLSQLCSPNGKNPSDRTVRGICNKFGVNEVWLKTGVGEMKLPMPLDQQLAQIFADVQVSDDERARLVKAFASLPPEAYPQLYKWFLTLMENLGK